jgi:hypothetical protein
MRMGAGVRIDERTDEAIARSLVAMAVSRLVSN